MKATQGTMQRHSVLEVGRTADGVVVRVAGHGSVHESSGLKALAFETLGAAPRSEFTVDLSACDYLDSTFLGCLVVLHMKFNRNRCPRLQIAGSDDTLGGLFGASGLDRVLPRTDDPADRVDRWLVVPTEELDRTELGEHLVECHRRLAEVGGPEADTFATVADQIEVELAAARR